MCLLIAEVTPKCLVHGAENVGVGGPLRPLAFRSESQLINAAVGGTELAFYQTGFLESVDKPCGTALGQRRLLSELVHPHGAPGESDLDQCLVPGEGYADFGPKNSVNCPGHRGMDMHERTPGADPLR